MMSLSRSMLPFIGVLAALTALAACGDDDESFAPSGHKPVAKTKADLPKCVEAREGDIYAVEEDEVSFKCHNGEWVYHRSSDSRNDRGSKYDPSTGTLTDLRDNRTYRTVKIGDQIWMAENLKYRQYFQTELAPCYDDLEENCDKYGRMYPLQGIRNICPKGWHLPDSTEYLNLFDAAGELQDPPAMALKAADGWADYEGESLNGTDDLGFSLLAGGYMVKDTSGNKDYIGEGESTILIVDEMKAMQIPGARTYFYFALFQNDKISLSATQLNYYAYMRCVKD